MKKVRFSLQARMVFFSAALLLGVTASTAWLSSQPFIEENQSLLLELNSESSVKMVGELREYLELSSARLSALGKDLAHLSQLDPDSGFLSVALYSEEAQGAFSLERRLAPAGTLEVQDLAWLARWKESAALAARGQTQLLGLRSSSGPPTLALAVPYAEEGRDVSGRFLLGVLRPDRLQDLLGEGDPTVALLVDARGRLLAASSSLDLETGADLSERASVASFLQRKFNNGQSLLKDRGGRGRLLSTFRTTGFADSGVITEVPESAAFKAVAKVRRRTLLVGILIFCLAFLFGTFQSESITVPLGKLAGASREIAQGRFETPIEVKGPDEIEALAGAFSRMKTELRIRQEALVGQEKLATAGRIARNIGHEFGNMLQPMITKLDILGAKLSRSPDDEALSQSVEEIIQMAMLGSEICSGLMTLARERPDASQFARLRLAKTSKKAVQLLAHELKAKDVAPVIDLSEELEVTGVESQILQVLINLIVNALHAMQAGGKIEIRGVRDGDLVRLEVVDSGSGIKEEDLPKIFDPLFSTKGAKGNGLGLSIAKAILEAHNGRIYAESKVGVGTRMVLEFPAAGAAQAA